AIIPKMVGVLLALMITFPWLLSTITTFTTNVFNSIPNVVR
ncbi:MAG: flagellar biosynthetic protein FliQ, partial [SAR324 cluster bacterium]|nr:flagellar biosynthetic protein FliQ [SAR324 cluster bacterium]